MFSGDLNGIYNFYVSVILPFSARGGWGDSRSYGSGSAYGVGKRSVFGGRRSVFGTSGRSLYNSTSSFKARALGKREVMYSYVFE